MYSNGDSVMLNNLKIRTQISLGYVVPIAVIFMAAGFGLVSGKQVIAAFDEIHRVEKVLDYSGELESSTQAELRTIRAYFLTRNPVFLEEYKESKRMYRDAVAGLATEGLIRNTEQKKRIEDMIQLVDDHQQQADQILAIAEQGNFDAALARFVTFLNSKQIGKEFTDIDDAFEAAEQNILALAESQAENAVGRMNAFLLFGGFGLGIFAILVAFLITQRIGQIILSTLNAIAVSASEISTTTEEQERSAAQQAASVHETTTTMDELGASSQQSAQQAEAASLAVQIALEQSNKGNQAVQLTLEEMTELRHRVDNIAKEITKLTSQTQRISNISQLVSDIANQTNMLALNAAVEAVRAGEHGKGFAVVASEIRKLADQSKRSAGEISHLASEVENSISNTIHATEAGTRTVDSGMEITRRTTQAFADVSEAVNEVVTNNQQILLNIRQQASAIQQVLQAMTNINQGSQETALGIGQIRNATEKLNDAASVMQNLI